MILDFCLWMLPVGVLSCEQKATAAFPGMDLILGAREPKWIDDYTKGC